MAYYGYTRVSTKKQHLDRGIQEIEEFAKRNGMNDIVILHDKYTGRDYSRPNYNALRVIVRNGDTLVIPEIDRLGRSKAENLKELKYFKEKGVRVMILEIPTTLMDVSQMTDGMAKMVLEIINNMMIEIYATMAEAELIKKDKRRTEGIAAKKARGEWDDYGRPQAIPYTVFEEYYRKVLKGEMTGVACRRDLGISKTTYYRYKKKYDKMASGK